LFSLLSLLVGLPEGLLELEDLTCLQPVEGRLLSQLLIQGGHGLLKLTAVGALSQLLLKLSVLQNNLNLLGFLLVNVLLKATNLFLFSHKKLLELLNLCLEGWSHFLAVHKLKLAIRLLLRELSGQ
jgi:hypothetical protein